MAKATYRGKSLLGVYSFRGWVNDHHGEENGSNRQASRPTWSWCSSWEHTCWDNNYEAERERATGNGMDFWNLKTHPQLHTSSKKVTPPNPFKTIYQLPKHSHMSLWGSFSLKPPHTASILITLYFFLKENPDGKCSLQKVPLNRDGHSCHYLLFTTVYRSRPLRCCPTHIKGLWQMERITSPEVRDQHLRESLC